MGKNLRLAYILIGIMVIPFTVWTQSTTNTFANFESIYQETFDLIFSDAQKARHKLDSLEQSISTHWPDTLRAKVYKTKGIYFNTIGQPDSALIYLNKALKILPNKKDALYINTLTDLATVYKYKKDYKKALPVLDQILDNNNNLLLQARVKGQKASIYGRLQNFSLAIKYQLECLEDLKKANAKEIPVAIETFGLAVLHQKMDNHKEAKALFETCLPIIQKNNILSIYNKGIINLSYTEIALQNYTKADSLITLTEESNVNKNNPEVLSALNGAKAALFEETRQYDKALGIYRDLFEKAKETNNIYILNIVKSYIGVLQETNNTKAIKKTLLEVEDFLKKQNNTYYGIMDELKYYQYAITHLNPKTDVLFKPYQDKLIKLQDSVLALNKFTLQKQIEAENNRALQKAQKELLSAKVKEQRNKLVLISITAMVLLIIMLIIIKFTQTRRRLKETQLIAVESENKLLLKDIEKKEEIAELKKQELKEQTAEVIALTTERARYLDKFTTLIEEFDTETQKAIKEKLQSITKEDNYWNLLKEKFFKLNPNFTSTIREHLPNANSNIIDFCLLLKINISNKEIADLLNISYQSVLTKKSRLKKQLNLKEDDEITKFLENI